MYKFIIKVSVVFFMVCVITKTGISQYNKDSSSDNRYSKDLYGTKVEEPETYESKNPYEGVTSKESIEGMLQDIKRLNSMQNLEQESEEINLIQTGIELPKFSKAFGRKVFFKITENFTENAVPESVPVEKLAETIVKELIRLKKEGKLGRDKTGQEDIYSEDYNGKLSNVAGKQGKTKDEVKEAAGREYETQLEFEKGRATVSYLIFGEEIVIQVPFNTTVDFQEKETRLKRQLEFMSTLIEKLGRQK